MASSQLDIKIRTLIEGVQGIQQLVSQLTALHQQAAAVSAASAGASSGVQGLGTSAGTSSSLIGQLGAQMVTVQQHAKVAGQGLSELRSELSNVGAGFDSLGTYVKSAATAFVAFLAIKGIKDMADYAARTETLGITLDVVAKNAGYSKESITGFEKELKKLGITTQAARESMTAMIQAGIPLERQSGQSASNVARLARAAQDLAVVTGENSSDTLRRLTTNIQQMDTMGLRFMGLTVDIEAAQGKYAQSLGVSTGALTQQQKVMAVNNAVLAEASKLQGAYEMSMESVGKKVASLKRYQEELADAMGSKLLPAYAAVVDSATTLLVTLEAIAKGTDQSGAAAERFGASVGTLSNGLADAVTLLAQFASNNSDLLEGIGSNLVGLISDVVQFGLTLARAGEEAGIWNGTLWTAGLVISGFRDGLRLVQAAALEVSAAFSDVIGDILKGLGLLAGATGFDEISSGLLGMSDSFHQASKASEDAAVKIINDFAEGRTATQDFLNGVKSVSPVLSDFGKASTFKKVAEEIALLEEATKKGVLSTAELGKANAATAEDVMALVRSGKLSNSEIDILLQGAAEVGVVLPEGFKSGSQAVKSLADEAKKTSAILSTLGSATTYEGITKELMAVKQALDRGQISSIQAGTAFDTLTKSVTKFGDAGNATSKQMLDLRQQLSSIGTSIGDEFSKALKDMNTSSDKLASNMDEKFRQMAGGLKTFAGNAQATSEQFRQALSQNIDSAKTVSELNLISESFAVIKERAKNLIDAGNIAEGNKWLAAAADAAGLAKGKFEALFDASLKASKTGADFSKLAEDVKAFAAEAGQSSEWVSVRLAAIATAAKTAAQGVKDAEIAEPLKKIGMTAEEMRGQASKAIEGVITELSKLRVSAEVTADGYYRAFTKAVGMAKSIEDISAFKTELSSALQSGKIGWAEYSASLQNVDAKFNDLFQAQLKAAKTKEDFALLRAEVEKLGASGSISATQMGNALRQIGEAASGSQAQILRLSQEMANVAKANLGVAQAESGVNKANLEIQRAKNELVKAENIDRQQGTALSRAEVEAAKARVAAAEARQKVEQANLAVMQAQLAVVQAQSGVATAQATYDKDKTAANQAALDAATKLAVQAQANANATQAAAAAAQAEAVAMQDAADSAKAYAENIASASNGSARTISGGAESQIFGGSGSPTTTTTLITVESINKAYRDIGASAEEAARLTAKWGDNLDQSRIKSQWASKIWSLQVEAFNKDLELQRKLITERKEAEEALLASQQKEATQLRENFSQAQETLELQRLGLSGLSMAADEVSKAYREIKKSAAEGAQSAAESARSFTSSAASIHDELLTAQGKEDEVSARRFESRRQELTIQYEQLKVQIMIARVQAQAAGVSTADLEKAAAEASKSYKQAQSDLNSLERIQVEKERKAKLDNASTAKEQAKADADSNSAQKEKNSLLSQEAALREKNLQLAIAARGSEEIYANLSRAVSGAHTEGMGDPLQSIAQGGWAKGMNVTDVSKIVLESGGQSAEVYMPQGETQPLLDILTDLSKRSRR